ncbi:MAG: tRNA pseudouridine(55) synthase TruB [Proteobacteria bacterium]|nr:MAG: tRNA pseudouridine(55) synthase TruB [Pseudomonadota bacterium]
MSPRSRRAKDEAPGPSGFLVVDKPAGWTSHDVVDAARRWFGTQRVGHLGTLDPQATGVLPLAIRDATKLVSYVNADPKVYRGAIRLGIETDTLDGDGAVVARHEGALPDEAAVREVLQTFLGEHEQVPPMYSAVKQGGVPLYRLARRGEEVERAPRKVRIDAFTLLSYAPPSLEVEVVCSPGTYVRVLAAEVGARLGCGGHLASLCRLRSGPFDLSQAVAPQALADEAERGEVAARLLRPVAALGMPALKLTHEDARRVLNGAALPQGGAVRAPGERVAALDPTGALLAILEVAPDRRLRPLRVLRRLAARS